MLKNPIANSHRLFLAVAVASASAALTGCVDHDYDLSKDIDLKVTLGGQELHLPASSTQELTMKQLLDLDAESSIKVVKKDGEYGLSVGDYVLVQGGTETNSRIDIDNVRLSDLKGDRTSTELIFPMVSGVQEIAVPTPLITSNLTIEDNNVDPNLKTLEEAETDLAMSVDVSSTFSGRAAIKKGFTVTFDEKWTVEIADNNTRSYAAINDGHTLVFTQDKVFGPEGFNLAVRVTRFKLGSSRGEGLYEVGHFLLNSEITFKGDMAVLNDNNQTTTEHVQLMTNSHVTSAVLNTVTGIVDPDITIKPTSVEINDIPDFLTDEKNNLDIADPQIYLYVSNTSPVPATINAQLVAYSSKGETTVGIGSNYGTDPVRIEANGTTCILLSRWGDKINHVYTPGRPTDYMHFVAVPDLGSLLNTVPDRIAINNVEAKADQSKAVTFRLGNGAHYEFTTDYEAVVPFSFGENMRLVYSTEDDGWDEDLDKYNFNEVKITAVATNSSPLKLHPTIEALGKNGRVLTNITAVVDRDIEGGSLASPTQTPVVITLRSTGENIADLKGISAEFVGTIAPQNAGVALNENHSVKFTDIQVSILGGITVDLNE